MYNFVKFISLSLIIVAAIILSILGKLSIVFLLSFLTVCIAVFVIFYKLQQKIFYKFRSEFDKLEEKTNLLFESIHEKRKILETLPAKKDKVSSLFEVSHNLIELSKPEEVFSFLVKAAEGLFLQADSILFFFLQKHSLALTHSSKKKDYVIKEKQGDIIEKWVLKHNQCLIVEDLMKDFRFDYNKVSAFNERGIRALIACPLSIGDTILGIIRVESKNPSSFSLDESRLLRGICDLGAVVLEKANLFQKAEELAIKDSLTSLYHKDYFFNRLSEEIKRADSKEAKIGIIMLDIDDFKKINDTYGHTIGDLVLKRLAKILTEIIGDVGNVISRFGGEEFIVYIVECDKNRLLNIAEKIRKTVEVTVISFRRKDINFTVSLGAILYPEDGMDSLGLVSKVDQLLYKAKNEGKNRVCFMGQ